MKMFNKIFCVFMAAALMCTVIALSACESVDTDESSQEPTDITYKISIKDALGQPYTSGIIVKFMQNGESVSMKPCDSNGIVTETLKAGEYGIVLGFTDSEADYHYNEELSVTSDANELEIILAKKINSEAEVIYAQSNEYDAYHIYEGCTYIELESEHRNYFLFTPTVSGNYEFSVVEGVDVQIGYYGGVHFVQEHSAAEVVNNSFTISVSDSTIGTDGNGTTAFVIGVDAVDTNVKNCVFTIKRIGDAEKTFEDYPWDVYEKTVELIEYDLPEGAVIQEFDLTASTDTYNLIYNEEDGFYHLDSQNGPLVLVRLAEDSEYIDCYETILDSTGAMKYFFDENGELLKKENYSNCLLEYISCTDLDEGVYPLTEDLKYIIQQHGDHMGWWDTESYGYLFEDASGYPLPDINNEIAWLLMCCYIE